MHSMYSQSSSPAESRNPILCISDVKNVFHRIGMKEFAEGIEDVDTLIIALRSLDADQKALADVWCLNEVDRSYFDSKPKNSHKILKETLPYIQNFITKGCHLVAFLEYCGMAHKHAIWRLVQPNLQALIEDRTASIEKILEAIKFSHTLVLEFVEFFLKHNSTLTNKEVLAFWIELTKVEDRVFEQGPNARERLLNKFPELPSLISGETQLDMNALACVNDTNNTHSTTSLNTF